MKLQSYKQADIDKARELFRQTNSFVKVAEIMGCSRSSVRRWASQNWIWKDGRKDKPARVNISELHQPIGKLSEKQLLRAIMYVKVS